MKKEIGLALAILSVPFLIFLHLLFNDEILTSPWYLLGYEYFPSQHPSNQHFAYLVLRFTIPAFLFFIFFLRASLNLKLLLIWPLHMVLWRLIGYVAPTEFDNEYWLFELISFSLIALFLVKPIKKFLLDFFSQNRSKRNFIGTLFTKLGFKWLFLAILLTTVPFIHNIWKYFPQDTPSLNFGLFVFPSYGFYDANTALFHLNHKMAVIIPLVVWFFIEKKWWKYALLSPILFYCYQFLSVFQTDESRYDENGLAELWPALTLLTLLLFFLAQSADHNFRYQQMYTAYRNHFETLLKKRYASRARLIQEQKQQLSLLKKQESTEKKELMALKGQLEQELKNS